MCFFIMDSLGRVPTFRGRFLGVSVLVGVQVVNGFIHVFSGLVLVLGSYVAVASSSAALFFGVYNLVYGVLTVFFTYLFW